MIVRSAETDSTTSRFYGLDTLRAVAALLVVLFHAGMPYIPEPMPGVAWPIENTSSSPLVAAIFWSIECFIMPLFFVISGVSTRVLLERKGVRGTLANRRDRILKPFLVCGLLILVSIGYIWNYGYYLRGEITWSQYIHFDAQDYDPNLLGLGPFWYLQYLLMFTVLMCLSCAVRKSSQPSTEGLYRWGGRYQYLCLVGVTLAAGFLFLRSYPEIVIGFQHDFLPVYKRIFYFAFYFFGGISLVSSVRQNPQLARLVATGFVTVGVIAMPFVVALIRANLQDAPIAGSGLLPFGMVFVAVAMSLGLTTLALDQKTKPVASVMWCAGAAYWVYLIHSPIVGLTQLAIDNWDLSASVKFFCTSIVAITGSLGTYSLFVRNTRLGVLLNGARGREMDPETREVGNAIPCQSIESLAT